MDPSGCQFCKGGIRCFLTIFQLAFLTKNVAKESRERLRSPTGQQHSTTILLRGVTPTHLTQQNCSCLQL